MKAFETHVTGIKRTAVPEHLQQMKEFDEVYDLTALDQQLQKADIVIGCLPGTPETKCLLNYERLYSMKKDAILVNVGRGSLIPTEDLIRVLEEGHLKKERSWMYLKQNHCRRHHLFGIWKTSLSLHTLQARVSVETLKSRI